MKINKMDNEFQFISNTFFIYKINIIMSTLVKKKKNRSAHIQCIFHTFFLN